MANVKSTGRGVFVLALSIREQLNLKNAVTAVEEACGERVSESMLIARMVQRWLQ